MNKSVKLIIKYNVLSQIYFYGIGIVFKPWTAF